MRIEAGLSRCLLGQVPWVVESPSLSCKGIQGGFERLWKSGAGFGRVTGDSSAA
jgi:hypothetical protein